MFLALKTFKEKKQQKKKQKDCNLSKKREKQNLKKG